jgi:hypothetical protein
MKTIVVLILSTCLIAGALSQQSDLKSIEKALGRKGAVQGDVLKVTFPRSDLKVNVGNVQIEPALALTSWIAFTMTGDHTMMMGDLVLLDAEVAPVISKLVANGIEISALHNHIVGESPSIKYLHFSAKGDGTELANAMMSVLSVTATPLSALQSLQSVEHDWSKVESTLGWTGPRKGNVLQVGIPRSEPIVEGGMNIPPYMGMSTAINFQAVGDKAATTGDFVLLASEVNPVIKALTESGIRVSAIHNHMLFESPRLFFLHFWGFDASDKLASGLRAALDKTNSVKSKQ